MQMPASSTRALLQLIITMNCYCYYYLLFISNRSVSIITVTVDAIVVNACSVAAALLVHWLWAAALGGSCCDR